MIRSALAAAPASLEAHAIAALKTQREIAQRDFEAGRNPCWLAALRKRPQSPLEAFPRASFTACLKTLSGRDWPRDALRRQMINLSNLPPDLTEPPPEAKSWLAYQPSSGKFWWRIDGEWLP